MTRILATLAVFLLCWMEGPAMAFELKSPAFAAGGDIPVKHACDGPDLSPVLRWTDPPEKTKTFALIADDPDAPAGTWVHWVLYEIPAALRELPEGVPARDTVAGIGIQGMNDFRSVGYGGPCPPPRAGPPLLLHALRAGRRAEAAPAQDHGGPAEGAGGARAGAGRADGPLQAEVTAC